MPRGRQNSCCGTGEALGGAPMVAGVWGHSGRGRHTWSAHCPAHPFPQCHSVFPSVCPSVWHLHTGAKGSGRQKKTFFPVTYFHHLLQFNIQVRKQMETSPVVLANGNRKGC